jgi:magnesium chelatase subunit H
MLFMEDHIQAVLPALQARRDHCDAMVAACRPARSSADPHGRFMTWTASQRPDGAAEALRGKRKPAAARARAADGDAAPHAQDPALHSRHGAGRARLLPDHAVLAAGSDENIANMVRFWSIATPTGRAPLRGTLPPPPPAEYPESASITRA